MKVPGIIFCIVLWFYPFILNAQQFVGINTVDPSEALEVVGNIELSGIVINENFAIPTLLNNWVNYGGDYATTAYYKDKNGRVFLRGLIRNGSLGTLFTLPAGYRPSTSGRQIFPIASNDGAGRIDVDMNGNVIIMVGSSTWTSLNGISFRAD